MSRSRRTNPIRGITTSDSDKGDKQLAHREERRRVRVTAHIQPDSEVWPHTRELSNPWCMAKDGKRRFDSKIYPGLMRK